MLGQADLSSVSFLDLGTGSLPDRPAWLPDRSTLQRAVAGALTYPYYRLQLVEYVCRLLPADGDCALLDVGAGDGLLAAMLAKHRPRTRVVAVETFLRPERSKVPPFVRFDGVRLPFADSSFDVALLLNVLHHATEPRDLLLEVVRVTRGRVIVKDHLAENWVDRARLSLLDIAGNLGTGAEIHGSYASQAEWDRMLHSFTGIRVTWHRGLSFRTGILKFLFPNELENLARIDVSHPAARGGFESRPG